MHDKHLFEYAVIRVVPRVEREEFMNVGIILYCQPHNFLRTVYELNGERLKAFYPSIDLEELHQRLESFVKISKGKPEGGVIGQLPAASRFRWLTAARSTVIQTSPVHPGLCNDPESKLEKLFRDLVQQ